MAGGVKRRRAAGDGEASLSFLDVIACAFGAIVLLVLVLPVGMTGVTEPGVDLSDYGAVLLRLAERREAAAALEDRLAADRRRAETLDETLSGRKNMTNALNDLLAQTRASARAVGDRMAAARQAKAAELAAQRSAANESRPTEYAGIPVDSEYVAIVIDTSGSMRAFWEAVIHEVESVLAIYPEVRGFQILSASGDYLWKPGTWIEDDPANRRMARSRLRTWTSASVSSPEPGILTAVRDLYRPGRKMAIFVFGDDYQGTDFDNFLAAVESGAGRDASLGAALRIHAFGFETVGSPNRSAYATLMRELTGRHDGAFLALPSSGECVDHH